jgi:hypothetical protein
MFFSKENKIPRVTKTKRKKINNDVIEYFKATMIKKPIPAKQGYKGIDGSNFN